MPKVNIYLTGAGYEQLDNLTQQIDYNSFVDINHLKGQELLFGQMPKIRTDIVIDKQLVEKLATYRSAVASLHDSIESYIGTYIYVGTLDLKLKIVGIYLLLPKFAYKFNLPWLFNSKCRRIKCSKLKSVQGFEIRR